MNVNEVIGGIYAGDFDGALSKIQEACRQRAVESVSLKLVPGMWVTAKNLRPKYICGKPARVIRVNGATVTVVFDPPVQNGIKTWRECRLPLASVEVASVEVMNPVVT